jgi:hypothetical protein
MQSVSREHAVHALHRVSPDLNNGAKAGKNQPDRRSWTSRYQQRRATAAATESYEQYARVEQRQAAEERAEDRA